MKYISTRGNSAAVTSAQAINLGMVPQGGLFVPQSIPEFSTPFINDSYQKTAFQVLAPFLTDFSTDELGDCISRAYNSSTFDAPSVLGIKKISSKMSVMELWHGPTAAFKDVALQIMPHFMQYSKQKTGNKRHTVILVATSGDTGKAALEGFKNSEGISIIVFYPHGGVSEVQRLQMATTDGSNTYVAAVKGNFDDCQTGVKQIFSDREFSTNLDKKGFELSSANSINWGRLCPQIAYYFHAYRMLVKDSVIKENDPVNFCVPTGNFGNILAGYYAKMMGLPIRRLICASNKNRILSDFFSTGTYDRNRDFFKTISPSMDILISSNLERFLFEMNGKNGDQINSWYSSLSTTGVFSIDKAIKQSIDSTLLYGWVDEPEVLNTIRETFDQTGYITDTHTAVAMAACKNIGPFDEHTIVASTASPYKFSCDVMRGLGRAVPDDEFEAVQSISDISKTPVHRAVLGLRSKTVRHNAVITIDQMKNFTTDIINTIAQ
ncbi:MAG: threonine synthase [Chitinispirillaceae bacterium]|nr:threonine synthase [Chitinispirillaceae bacterium]